MVITVFYVRFIPITRQPIKYKIFLQIIQIGLLRSHVSHGEAGGGGFDKVGIKK